MQNIYKQGDLSGSNPYRDFKTLNTTFQFKNLPPGDSIGFPNETLLLNSIRFNLSNDVETAPIPENKDNEETVYLKWKETPDSDWANLPARSCFREK